MMYVFTNLRRWIKARKGFEWFALFFAAAAIGGGIVTYFADSQQPLRQFVLNVAFGLELIGLGTVALAMGRLQEHFEELPWWAGWWQAWTAFGGVFRKPKHVETSASLSTTLSMSGRARARTARRTGPPGRRRP